MSTSSALATWLADFSPERLTELLEQRELPHAARFAGGSGVRTMSELAEHLLADASARIHRVITVGEVPQNEEMPCDLR